MPPSSRSSNQQTTSSQQQQFQQQLHLANKVQAEELYGLTTRNSQLLAVLASSIASQLFFGYSTLALSLFGLFCAGTLYVASDGFSPTFIQSMIARGMSFNSSNNNNNKSQQPLNLYQPRNSIARGAASASASAPANNNNNNTNQSENIMKPIHMLYGDANSENNLQNPACRIIPTSSTFSTTTGNNNNNNNGEDQNNNNDNGMMMFGGGNNNNHIHNNNSHQQQSNFVIQKTGLFTAAQPLWFRGGQHVDRFNDVPHMLNQVDSQGVALNQSNLDQYHHRGNAISNFFSGQQHPGQSSSSFINGLQVSFSLFNKQASSTTQTDVAATFAALGIRDPNVSTARVVNWILSIMKKVATEIGKSDKEVNGLLAGVGTDFRCALSLTEESPVNSLAPPQDKNKNNSGGWGSSGGSSGGGGWGSSGGSGGGGGWGGSSSSSSGGGGWGSGNKNTSSSTSGGWGSSTSTSGGGGGGGWGSSGTNNNSNSNNNNNNNSKPRKLDVLLQEQKRLETSGGSDARTIQDTVKRVAIIDLRLQLDALLDIEGTFPPTIPSKPQDKSRRQTYVAQRVATLAASSGLAAFNFFGGDADRWNTSLPSDPLIVVHILRHRAFRGMVRLAHEPAKEKELSLCVGHTGHAPCFFVRYANPPEVPYKEFHPAANSKDGLYHAVLMLIAIIANKHKGSYGTLATGVVDLQQLKMDKIV